MSARTVKRADKEFAGEEAVAGTDIDTFAAVGQVCEKVALGVVEKVPLGVVVVDAAAVDTELELTVVTGGGFVGSSSGQWSQARLSLKWLIIPCRKLWWCGNNLVKKVIYIAKIMYNYALCICILCILLYMYIMYSIVYVYVYMYVCIIM